MDRYKWFKLEFSPEPIRDAAVLLAPGATGGYVVDSPEVIRVAAALLAPGPEGGYMVGIKFKLVYTLDPCVAAALPAPG